MMPFLTPPPNRPSSQWPRIYLMHFGGLFWCKQCSNKAETGVARAHGPWSEAVIKKALPDRKFWAAATTRNNNNDHKSIWPGLTTHVLFCQRHGSRLEVSTIMLLTVSNKEGRKDTCDAQACPNISQCHLIDSEVLGSYIKRYFKREDKLLVSTSSAGGSSSCLSINVIHECLSKILLEANIYYIEKDEQSYKAMRKRLKKKGTDLKFENNSLSKVGLGLV